MRYAECDQQGVAFNAHYLTWADEAMTAWWAHVGIPWADLITLGGEPLVKASSLEWRAPVHFGDSVDVEAVLESVGRTSLTIAFTVRRGPQVCCEVRTTYVWVTPDGPAPWPPAVRALLEG